MSSAHFVLNNVSYRYDEDAKPALNKVSFSVNKGEFVAVLGHNGSGKSTLAKLLNGLFLPSEGHILVSGMDTRDEQYTWDIRQKAGMVFQNPDNQIVATVVRDDVAFGMENIGVPSPQMPPRIDEALGAVGMLPFVDRAPHLLSGGQKQRVAIAGILAMHPEALILDEATAMLDPSGRKEVFDTVQRLNQEQGITVIWITHFMEEAAKSERVMVIHQGEVRMDGTPREVFAQGETLRSFRLDVPPMALLSEELRGRGIDLPPDILTVEDMEREVLARCR
jgi:energy-coupling factor transport system ATP-binding protein